MFGRHHHVHSHFEPVHHGSFPPMAVPVPGVDADFNWVVPGLAVGGQPTRQQTYRLRAMGIGAVLSLRAEDDCEDDPRWAQRCGLRYQRITVPDAFPIPQETLDEVATIVEGWRSEGLSVLVHCQAGRRRGPIGAAAVLVAEGWDVEHAMHRLRDMRHQFAPTPDQVRSLRTFAKRRAPLRWFAGRVQELSGHVGRSLSHEPHGRVTFAIHHHPHVDRHQHDADRP